MNEAAVSAANPKFASYRGGYGCGLRFKSGPKVIAFPVSFSIPKFARRSRPMLANFGIGTLVPLTAAKGVQTLLRLGWKEGTRDAIKIDVVGNSAWNARQPHSGDGTVGA